MMTGEQYKESLFDGRATFFEGKRVDDLPGPPVPRPAASSRSPTTTTGWPTQAVDGRSPDQRRADDRPRSCASKVDLVHTAGMMAHVTYTSIMTLATAAGQHRRHGAAVRRARSTATSTTPSGATSASPSASPTPRATAPGRRASRTTPTPTCTSSTAAPTASCIRGAKLHITGASLGHELMTIPTKAMKAGEEEYAIAAHGAGERARREDHQHHVRAAPRRTPATSRCRAATSYARGLRHLRRRVRAERAHLPRRRGGAAPRVFAHSLGLWERLGGLTGDGRRRRRAGRASPSSIAEANGLAGEAHIKEKISEMIIHATVVRACSRRRSRTAEAGEFGAAFPDELYTNAGKYTGAASYNLMVRHLHDIAGGAVVTAPSIADLENPEVGHLARKYMSTRQRRRRRVPHPAVPRHPRPHRRLLRRLAGGHQHPGRRRAVRPAHRHPQALRPRRRQAGSPAGRRLGASLTHLVRDGGDAQLVDCSSRSMLSNASAR